MGRGGSRQWRALRAVVLEQEPYCQLRFVGCTDVSAVVDHIKPVRSRPDLEYERSNLQGACASCNGLKSNLTLEEAVARYGQHEPAEEPEALRFFR